VKLSHLVGFITKKYEMLVGEGNSIKLESNVSHLMKDKSVHWTDDLHSIRRVGQADWPATWSHPELSVPVTKDRNN